MTQGEFFTIRYIYIYNHLYLCLSIIFIFMIYIYIYICECFTQFLPYKATSTTSRNSFGYYETSEREFKTRYNNQTISVRHRECMNETELSKHAWNLKDHGLDNNLSWEIHKKASPCQCGSKRCDLCLSE